LELRSTPIVDHNKVAESCSFAYFFHSLRSAAYRGNNCTRHSRPPCKHRKNRKIGENVGEAYHGALDWHTDSSALPDLSLSSVDEALAAWPPLRLQ